MRGTVLYPMILCVAGETDGWVTLGLDGGGSCQVATGVPFLDHMLHQMSSHGLIDLELSATGDTHIDDLHTKEDVGIALAQEELGYGIARIAFSA